MTKAERQVLRDLAQKSTPVVSWYPHPYEGQIRGPWNRWFTISGDPAQYKKRDGVLTPASYEDDVNFAAAAMNNMVALLDEIERLERDNQDLKNLHKRCCL